MNHVSEYVPVAAIDAESGDDFGFDVAMSGNYAIVGATSDDVGANLRQGSAKIFRFDGTKWVFMQDLFDPDGQADDRFGGSVSISGNYAVVGSSFDNNGMVADQGSICVFRFDGASWVFMQKLTDPGGVANDRVGIEVAIAGNYIIAAAPFDVVAGAANRGSASIFNFDGTNWIFMQTLTDPDGQGSDCRWHRPAADPDWG